MTNESIFKVFNWSNCILQVKFMRFVCLFVCLFCFFVFCCCFLRVLFLFCFVLFYFLLFVLLSHILNEFNFKFYSCEQLFCGKQHIPILWGNLLKEYKGILPLETCKISFASYLQWSRKLNSFSWTVIDLNHILITIGIILSILIPPRKRNWAYREKFIWPVLSSGLIN